MKTKQLTQRLLNIKASQQSVYFLSWSPIHCTCQPNWPPKLASPLLKTVSIWLELYSNLLLLSLLPVACLIPAWCHFCTVAPYCWAMNPFSQLGHHASHPPSFSPPPPPSSFLSTPLPVALQISGGRQCQTFQLFKQVSGWCRVPAGVALPLWCPTSLVCANPPESVVPKGAAAGPKLYWCSAERCWIYMLDLHAFYGLNPFFCFPLLNCWKEKWF